MGRHSAPDDEDDSAVALRERDDPAATGSDVEDPDAGSRGRHSRGVADADSAAVDDAAVDDGDRELVAAPAASAINGVSAPVRPTPNRVTTKSPTRPPPPLPPPAADDSGEVPLDELIAQGEPDAPADSRPIDNAPTDVIPAVAAPPVGHPTDTTAPFAPVSGADEAGEGSVRRSPVAAASGAAHNSAADLHLARSHPSVLALCVAAIMLPFVAEIVVLLVLGTFDQHSFLVWIWAPIVGAGVLLGAVLDLAHRHFNRVAAPPSQVPSV